MDKFLFISLSRVPRTERVLQFTIIGSQVTRRDLIGAVFTRSEDAKAHQAKLLKDRKFGVVVADGQPAEVEG